MPLPLSVAAVPRQAVPGSSPVQQSGGAAGFDAVMNGVLASDAKTSLGTAQQTPDGGAQEEPAGDGSGPVARAAKPEASKVAKDRVDAVGVVEAAGVAGAVVVGAVAPPWWVLLMRPPPLLLVDSRPGPLLRRRAALALLCRPKTVPLTVRSRPKPLQARRQRQDCQSGCPRATLRRRRLERRWAHLCRLRCRSGALVRAQPSLVRSRPARCRPARCRPLHLPARCPAPCPVARRQPSRYPPARSAVTRCPSTR
ncbi:hypothetical protein AHiyo8_24140 [Arthrobacter sp. Hiyo8]|nr:hypothetical protein AHiyo8_24140 [Arthrobacter sp. Hiyo8]